ncbi:MAG: hypothetical protein AB1Z98_13270 [Nannocystaceae bacterium]
MGATLEDDRLLGHVDMRDGDLHLAVLHVAAHDLIGERVGQPRVTAAELPDPGCGLGGETLAGRCRVLFQQLANLGLGERVERGRLGRDVER